MWEGPVTVRLGRGAMDSGRAELRLVPSLYLEAGRRAEFDVSRYGREQGTANRDQLEEMFGKLLAGGRCIGRGALGELSWERLWRSGWRAG